MKLKKNNGDVMDTHFLICKTIDRIEAVSAAAPVLPAIAEIYQPTFLYSYT